MTNGEIENKVIQILRRRLKPKEGPISVQTRLREDLGADSLNVIELAMDLEEAFGVPMPDEQFVEIRTIGDAVNAVRANAG